MPTTPPTKCIIQSHSTTPATFSLVFHLRVEFSTARQYNLGPLKQGELEHCLWEWGSDPDGFLLRRFGWDAKEIDQRIRSHGDTRRPSSPGPLDHITLNDLGL